MIPKIVRNPVGRDGEEPLVVEEGLEGRPTGRIALQDRAQVRSGTHDQRRVLLKHSPQQGFQLSPGHVFPGKFLRQAGSEGCPEAIPTSHHFGEKCLKIRLR